MGSSGRNKKYLNVKRGNVCLTCRAPARSVVKMEAFCTLHGRSAEAGRIGGVVDSVEPSTGEELFGERAVTECACVARAGAGQAENNRIAREWTQAQTVEAVEAQSGSGPRMLVRMRPGR